MERNYIEELLMILSSDVSDAEKKEKILHYHDSDIADMIESLDEKERAKVYELLGDENIASIFSYLDNVEDIVEELGEDHMADILEKMDADDAVDVLEELEEEQRDEIISLMDKESAQDISMIQEFPIDSIGSRMTNNFISIYNTDSIKIAMKKVIKTAATKDNVTLIYVVTASEELYGVIELRSLIIARENDDLDKIIMKNYPYFYATDEVDSCIIKLKEYALDSYPILDKDKKLIGVITADDVVEAVDDEFGDDYAKLAGLTEEEDIRDSTLDSVKKRLPWLVILLVLGLFQSFAMTGFEHVVAALPVIVFFQTLVLDCSGNTGTQSLAVTIRMLSDQEDKNKRKIKTIFKELRTGFINGLALGIIAFIIVFIFMFVTKQSIGTDTYHVQDAIKASGIVSIALLIAMTLTSCLGTIVPIIFLKIGIDPAVASGPFITTISDVAALLIYYGLAYFMFLAF